jgi:murein L,D-transpeptidase YafK
MQIEKSGRKSKSILLWILILLPYLLLVGGFFIYQRKLAAIRSASVVVINKSDMTLTHYDFEGNMIQKTGIACGKNPGNKKKIGDNKTPEGVFRVSKIQHASDWTHDFKDDSLGEIAGAYGPFFIRLDVPGQKGIGIHGTHDSGSIGSRASEGCIRLDNQAVTQLANSVKPGTLVLIVPGSDDILADRRNPSDSVPAKKFKLVSEKTIGSGTAKKKEDTTQKANLPKVLNKKDKNTVSKKNAVPDRSKKMNSADHVGNKSTRKKAKNK